MPVKNKKTNQHYFELFKSATAVIMDVDGVLTDGSLLITESGEELRTMNIRDGYALQLAVKKGFRIAVITGAKSEGVVRRLNRLGIIYVLAGVDDKKSALMHLSDSLQIDLATTIYIGDDIPDLQVMQLCGIPCCPHDATTEVLAVSKYISPNAGGRGCVRDILEKTMKIQGRWE